MKVHVNGILVKSKDPQQHWQDLEEMFKTLWKYNMRLNLKKCEFGVKIGKFLKFMLFERGIEANPAKFQAIINMKSLMNVREVQALNDILVAFT